MKKSTTGVRVAKIAQKPRKPREVSPKLGQKVRVQPLGGKKAYAA